MVYYVTYGCICKGCNLLNTPRGSIHHNVTNYLRGVFSILGAWHCGCSYSSYVKKGHVYLRCTKSKQGVDCNQPPTSEEQLIPQVNELLEKLALSEQVVLQVLDILKKGHDDVQLYYQTAITETRNKIMSGSQYTEHTPQVI